MARLSEFGPSAATQFKAIAWIRWRLFANSFRRKGGKGELVARIIFLPVGALFAIGPIAGAGAGAFYAIHAKEPWVLPVVTWLVFVIWVLITMATTLQPSSVDLSLLLRFPIRFRSYVTTRFFFGLLATPNVIGTLALAAAAIGIGIAKPALFPWAALVMFTYSLAVILLLRMVLLWLDRWLAQRRTREIVGVLFAMFAVGVQVLNFQFQGWMRHSGSPPGMARFAALKPIYHDLQPVLALLPPTLAANSVLHMQAMEPLPALAKLAAVFAFACVFGALFALRLRGEFRGENFNEAPARGKAKESAKTSDKTVFSFAGVPPPIVACMEKELRYLMRGPSALIGILMPLFLVGLYANRLGSSRWALPLALAYTMFAMLPMLYNVLGQDAAGAQLYLLSPTPIRWIFLAKNIVLSALIFLVAALSAGLVAFMHPPSGIIAAGTLFWLVFVLLTNLSFGNWRSLTSPIKVDMGKIQRRQSRSQFSILIIFLVLLGSLLAGFAILWTSHYLDMNWAGPTVLLAMAAAAFVIYLRGLKRIEQLALEQRDTLIEVLGKA